MSPHKRDQNIIRLGTRGSQLAMWQAEHVRQRLESAGFGVEIHKIRTLGDRDKVTDFGSLGAKGLFVKEIEQALIEDQIDLAVHSLKDLPTELPEGLILGAVLSRENPFDALVSRDGKSLAELPDGATVATGSARRGAQVLALRPDLNLIGIRGNVRTRIRKIRDGLADATFLAMAGLRRMELAREAAQVFTAAEMTPSMGQGTLGIETRAGEWLDALASLEEEASRLAAEAEREFIRHIGGGCKTPAGVLAEPVMEGTTRTWRLTGMIASPDGKSLLRETRMVPGDDHLRGAALDLGCAMVDQADDAIRATLTRV